MAAFWIDPIETHRTTFILPGGTVRNQIELPWRTGLFVLRRFDGVRTWEIAADVHVSRNEAGHVEMRCELYVRPAEWRGGYDIEQLRAARVLCEVPLVASGGAGAPEHFLEAFRDADVDAALAASVFHSGAVPIPGLKSLLHDNGIEVRRG